MKLSTLIIGLVAFGSTLGAQTTHFVTTGGNDTDTGTSWGTSLATVQHALSVSASGDAIWVAAGTYKPSTSDVNVSFQLKNGVALYGGFAGTESTLGERNWQANVTTLSGDIDNDGTLSGNSLHVVYGLFNSSTAILDGFVIFGGNSSSDGGGIHLLVASPTLSNLLISGNHASANGGGMDNNSGSPSLTNCTFTGNTANDGGGLYNYGGSLPVLTNCVFRNDTASTFGGGLYDAGNAITPQNLLFDGNHATTGGGGLFASAPSSPTALSLSNLTFYGNTSKYGGAIFVSGYTAATMANTILWNDSATTTAAEIYSTSSQSTTAATSLVQGGVLGAGVGGSGLFVDGGNNIEASPLFTDSSSHDFSLTGYSPAIDGGNNAAISASTDLVGNTRVSNGTVDIGAYEYQGAPLAVQMASFAATTSGMNAELTWRTETETDNFGFEIERRKVEAGVQGSGEMGSDGATEQKGSVGNSSPRLREESVYGGQAFKLHSSQWSKIGFVKGSGTSSSPREYSYADQNLFPGHYAYRIRQIDKDGSFTYTSALELEIGLAPKVFTLAQNYPNPFNPATTIKFTLPEDGRVRLKIYNMMGQEVATLVDEDLKAGVYQQVVFDGSRLASGTYFSRLEFGGNQLIKKMILMK